MVWCVVGAVLIVRYLEQRGERINWLFIRLFLFRYVHRYTQITRQETGRIGPLFYHFVVPPSVALALCIVLALRGWS